MCCVLVEIPLVLADLLPDRARPVPRAPPVPRAIGASRVTAVCPCGPSVLLGLPGGARACCASFHGLRG